MNGLYCSLQFPKTRSGKIFKTPLRIIVLYQGHDVDLRAYVVHHSMSILQNLITLESRVFPVNVRQMEDLDFNHA